MLNCIAASGKKQKADDGQVGLGKTKTNIRDSCACGAGDEQAPARLPGSVIPGGPS